MASLTLSHSFDDGTMLNCSERLPREDYDAVLAALRSVDRGWRWWRSMACFGRTGSRGSLLAGSTADRLADRLRALGHDVEVDVDQPAVLSAADVAAAREAAADRAVERADRLAERSEAKRATATATIDRARGMADAIPFGQPMLVGHHSYNRDRNYRNRIGRTFDRGFEQLGEADELARRAGAVRHGRDDNPAYCRRKLDAAEAELRRLDRMAKLSDAGEVARAEAEAEAGYFRMLLAEFADRNPDRAWSKATLRAGDRLVRLDGTVSAVVAKVNAKSVAARAVYRGCPVDGDPRFVFSSERATQKLSFEEVSGFDVFRQADNNTWQQVAAG